MLDCGHGMYLWKDAEKPVGLMTSLDNINCQVIDKNHLFDGSDQTKQCVTNVMPGDWQENKTSTVGKGWEINFHHFRNMTCLLRSPNSHYPPDSLPALMYLMEGCG